jgi:hypothetical protein|tara:strand:+ start:3334 stop:4737 length:1404 start_codon:yes stop_codon:yes gene_type:complete
MGAHKILSPRQKALQINLDNSIYGTFAEIGAGQEVARNFFQAGGAAGTIAKTMSAYDMTMSDSIYGESSRYVSEERLVAMLNHEFDVLIERLSKERGASSRFFAYANTVTAKGYRGSGNYHGWTGIRFQHAPNARPSQILVHLKLLDNQNRFQQQAIGVAGVNLLHTCFYQRDGMEAMVESLMDNLTNERVLIDAIKISGPAFAHLDERLLSLELVRRGYTDVILFNGNGKVVQPEAELYKKNLLTLRSGFRPPTLLSTEMLEKGAEMFQRNLPEDQADNIVTLAEISMNQLIERGEIDNADFLARIDMLSAINQRVLITNFGRYHRLNKYLSEISKRRIAFVVRVNNLKDILTEANYSDMDGGFFEGMGNLFSKNCHLYVYPEKADDSEQLIGSDDIEIATHLKPLVDYFITNKQIQDITNYTPSVANIWSRRIVESIEAGEHTWEEMVPKAVADAVKHSDLFSTH